MSRKTTVVAVAVLLASYLLNALVNPAQALAATYNEVFYSDNDILFYDPRPSTNSCSDTRAIATAGSATGGSVPTDFSLGSDPVQRRRSLVSVLMNDFNLTPEQAAGIVGNFMHESGGAHVPPNINESYGAGPPRFIGGYGWAQWTGGRQTTFIQYAIDNGYMASTSDHATDGANLAYLKHELANGYTNTLTELRKQTTPEDAAVSFEATFERAGVPALGPRMANARQAFNEYIGTTPAGSTATSSGPSACDTSPAGSGDQATIVGSTAFPLAGTKSVVKNPSIFSGSDTDRAGHPYTAYDIEADPGTEVVAFMGGTVTNVTEDRCPGRMVSIYNTESDLTVSYLHMDFSNSITQGSQVQAGDRVGIVGTAANGCGTPHLHIDAAKGSSRPGCSRLDCPPANQAYFQSIGPPLYQTFIAMPN